MKLTRTLCLLLTSLLATLTSFAQGIDQSAIGETMRSNGRIYVVVAVMLVILAGLILYLVRVDRKISKLEKD